MNWPWAIVIIFTVPCLLLALGVALQTYVEKKALRNQSDAVIKPIRRLKNIKTLTDYNMENDNWLLEQEFMFDVPELRERLKVALSEDRKDNIDLDQIEHDTDLVMQVIEHWILETGDH